MRCTSNLIGNALYVHLKALLIQSIFHSHTLKALQEMAEPCPPLYDRPRLETYKMSKYIVDVTANEIPPPEYLQLTELIDFKMLLQSNQESIKLRKEENDRKKDPSFVETEKTELPTLKSFAINPLELSDWPSATELGMDMPQYDAFQSAITQELAIMQGPPGNCKDFFCQNLVNVKFVHFVLLRNW